ncbi:unnamed protein product [Caenorhabditis sp. 36 PRJEB53466]|nr:unnamed protein product [Caenorhabditis sp. 36 PRJEB53466]
MQETVEEVVAERRHKVAEEETSVRVDVADTEEVEKIENTPGIVVDTETSTVIAKADSIPEEWMVTRDAKTKKITVDTAADLVTNTDTRMLKTDTEEMQSLPEEIMGIPRLAINVFGLQLDECKIFRHVVQMNLLDNNKAHNLTTMKSSVRGNRVSKQKDNFLLLDHLLEKWTEKTGQVKKAQFAYDGAQTLFTLEKINMTVEIPNKEALLISGISEFLIGSLNFLKCGITISCMLDQDKPSFQQTNLQEWSDPRFNGYLDIVTSQSAIRSGKYLSQSKGFFVLTDSMKQNQGWYVSAMAVHKSCRVVGQNVPTPILELDPTSTQYYAPMPVNEILRRAFPQDFSSRGINHPSGRLQLNVKLLLKDLKCNKYFVESGTWGTNTIAIRDIDYNAPNVPEYRQRYPDLEFPLLPAAVYGTDRFLIPLEYLKAIPYQSIDRRVLEKFEMILHFKKFGFNDEIMKAFAVQVCNDPFSQISYIDGERVSKPNIAYAKQVHVDDQKRDWKPVDKQFSDPAIIDHLVFVLVVGYSRNFVADRSDFEFVANEFLKRCEQKGMKIASRAFKCHNGVRGCDEFLKRVFDDLSRNPKYDSSTALPFVFLASDDIPNIHECLKYYERMADVPTQQVLLKTIRKIKCNVEENSQNGKKGFDFTLDNIVLKTNVKCGGLNYISIPEDIATWEKVSTFVMGMDVAHPDRGIQGSPSIVGLSCNSAENPFQFIGDFHYTLPRTEIIQDEILQNFTAHNVRKFAELRGFPKDLIIFRDGVSIGEESKAVREVEVIEKTIIEIAKEMGVVDYAPKVLAIVVKKRHHTRFYVERNDSEIQNPLPDTSVSGHISEYGKRQLFIQAFRPIQGTAKIPSFLIIRDDAKVSNDYISKLVCAVCSLHQIVNSPTSIPTPVFVAHEFAKRGSNMLKAYKYKKGNFNDDWFSLTKELSYSALERLSKMRIV